MRLSRSLPQFRAQICHKPWRAKSLRLAAAYTSYGAADKILRRLTAAARGSISQVDDRDNDMMTLYLSCSVKRAQTLQLGWLDNVVVTASDL